MNIRILGALGVAFFSSVPAYAEPETPSYGTVTETWQDPPAPSLYATFTSSIPFYRVGPTNDDNFCHLTVILGPNRPGRYLNYTLRDPSYSSYYNPVCFGVRLSGSVESQRQAVLQITQSISSIRIPFVNKSSWVSTPPSEPSCTVSFGVQYRLYKWSSYAHSPRCNVSRPPDPVSCMIDSPGVLQHKQQTAGDIRSVATAPLTVKCSGTARVTLSVPSSEIRLASGTTETALGSRLYLDHEGNTSTVIQGSPPGHVDVLNVINAVSVQAGVYQGSSVITANWD